MPRTATGLPHSSLVTDDPILSIREAETEAQELIRRLHEKVSIMEANADKVERDCRMLSPMGASQALCRQATRTLNALNDLLRTARGAAIDTDGYQTLLKNRASVLREEAK